MSWRHYVGIFLLSLATLVLELALTRVLSVALWYHFGFLVISTALLGFGASGGVLALWQGLRERAALDGTLTLLALLFGVLAGLLVCTGMGASLAGHLHSQPQQHLRWIIPLLLVTLVVTASLTPWLFAAALALPLVWRILLALLLIAPLGVLLGLPFPTGLRVVANEAAALVPRAWGVNGFFTVIGTAVALMLGMACGFKAVLVIADLCYVIALAAMLRCETPLPAEY